MERKVVCFKMRVRIVHSHDDWILSKMGKYLVNGINYATGPEDDGKPYDIVYYTHYSMIYSMIKHSTPTIIGAFFTHEESTLFKDMARKVDFCVCMCERYKKILQTVNHNVFVIPQPTDLERYKPKLILGFVGRFYKTKRKGKDLLDKITKLPFVEIKMTLGKIKEGEMNNFYNSLDYVLNTSKIEGGPMCLTEGLACGKEIIIPDVGMVDQFKNCKYVHIYDRNKPETLVNLLKELYQKKLEIRKTVEKYSIKNFIDEHKKLFERLVNEQIR